MGAVNDIWQSGLSGLRGGFKEGLVGAIRSTATGQQIEKEAIRQKIMGLISNPLVIIGIVLGFYFIFIRRS